MLVSYSGELVTKRKKLKLVDKKAGLWLFHAKCWLKHYIKKPMFVIVYNYCLLLLTYDPITSDSFLE